jgi:dolichyl-phosphate beta-glucosyltransferase
MIIDKSVSVVIPAYNEETNIAETLKKVNAFLVRHFRQYEIIVVEDGSADNTYKKVLQFIDDSVDNVNLRLMKSNFNKGKGHSVQRGMLAAMNELVLFSDADLSTPIEDVLKFLPYFDKGYDVVIGSRAVPGADILKSQGFLRRRMGRVFNLCIKTVLFPGINDTQCGFKCFRKGVVRPLFKTQRLEGFCFDAEILFLAKKWGYRIAEVPVRWANRENSHVSVVKDSVDMFRHLFTIRMNDHRGYYAEK